MVGSTRSNAIARPIRPNGGASWMTLIGHMKAARVFMKDSTMKLTKNWMASPRNKAPIPSTSSASDNASR